MAKKNDSYEAMMSRLEELVNIADNDMLTLEESMKTYEEGIKLCNKLYKVLNEAEGKIKVLSDGEEKDFMEIED